MSQSLSVPGVQHAKCLHVCRDVKPENLLISLNHSSSPGKADLKPHLRLIDMGSAVDPHSFKQLYGSEGPSEKEQTNEYAPPEVLLGR